MSKNGSELSSCNLPEGYIFDFTQLDCDDSDATLNYNDVDMDGWYSCEGDCDDNNADIQYKVWMYQDSDEDGFGTPAVGEVVCGSLEGYVIDNTDCDDSDHNKNNDVDVDGDGFFLVWIVMMTMRRLVLSIKMVMDIRLVLKIL